MERVQIGYYADPKTYKDTDKVRFKVYRKKGPSSKIHRERGPAVIKFNMDGTVSQKIYYKNGLIHRTNGAAEILYNNGKPLIKKYLCNGEYHRIGGPAVIDFSKGKPIMYFYIHGREYDRESYNQAIIGFKMDIL